MLYLLKKIRKYFQRKHGLCLIILSHYFYPFIRINSWVASLICFWISLETSFNSNTFSYAYIKTDADQRADRVSTVCATPTSPFSYAVNNKVTNKRTMEKLKHQRNPNVVATWIIHSGKKWSCKMCKTNKRNVLCILQVHFAW